MSVDINQLMQMAQSLRGELQRAQDEARNARVVGEAGGGLVRVTMNGKHEVLAVQIEAKAIDPTDPRLLEDLVRAATNDASARVAQAMQGKMSSLASGLGMDLSSLGIPGL